jgi:hypothetical protein
VFHAYGCGGARQVSASEMEAEFWRIVEEGEEAVEVLCGTDLDSAVLGSGFPRLGRRRAAHVYPAK